MSNVVAFLRQNGEKGLDLLKSQYFIHATRHRKRPGLVLLKYDQLNSPMSNSIVQECRGIVLDESNNWSIVVYPYQKFFNMKEVANAAVIDWNQKVRAYEKIDGSLLTMYWSQGEWHVATSGVPDASGKLHHDRSKPNEDGDDETEETTNEVEQEARSMVPDANGLTPIGGGPNRKSFAELFWEVFNLLGFKLPDSEEHRHKCYMFELATPQNIVLIPHKTPQLYIHGVRDLFTLEEELPDPYCALYNWHLTPLREVSSKSEFEREVLPSVTNLDGMVSEGYVICDAHFNRFKLKCPSYVNLALLHNPDGNQWKRLVAIAQVNEGSEFLAYFPQYTELYQQIFDRYMQIIDYLNKAQLKFQNLDLRELAHVCKSLPEWLSAPLFVTRKSKEDFKTFFSAPTRYGMVCGLLDPNKPPPTFIDLDTFVIPQLPPPQPKKKKDQVASSTSNTPDNAPSE